MNNPRMGRPKIDNPKGTQLSVRFDDEGLKIIDEVAKHFNETRAESLRRGIVKLYAEIKKD